MTEVISVGSTVMVVGSRWVWWSLAGALDETSSSSVSSTASSSITSSSIQPGCLAISRKIGRTSVLPFKSSSFPDTDELKL